METQDHFREAVHVGKAANMEEGSLNSRNFFVGENKQPPAVTILALKHAGGSIMQV